TKIQKRKKASLRIQVKKNLQTVRTSLLRVLTNKGLRDLSLKKRIRILQAIEQFECRENLHPLWEKEKAQPFFPFLKKGKFMFNLPLGSFGQLLNEKTPARHERQPPQRLEINQFRIPLSKTLAYCKKR